MVLKCQVFRFDDFVIVVLTLFGYKPISIHTKTSLIIIPLLNENKSLKQLLNKPIVPLS